jgi:putative FmdB family regulatory protein
MMTYEYLCQKCGKPFEVRASIADYSKGLKPECPHCGAHKAIRAFTSVNVLTSKRDAVASGAGCGPGSKCG